MRLTELGIDRDLSTVVVLGAGASRGSSCAQTVGVAPPLDTDFFAQAQRLGEGALTKQDRDLFSFVRQEFGQGNFPTLEVFFTQIAAVDRFHHEFNIQGRPSGKFSRQMATLRDLIPRVFSASLGGRDCTWHQRIASALRAGDAVMSFNYDTLMDQALRSTKGKRWDPSVGYGFVATGGTERWRPPPSPGRAVKNPVLLLKPHGSLNWSIDQGAQSVDLVAEYTSASAGSIVPPTWDKSDVSNWPWNDVWRSARKVLGAARMLVVVGYSVPLTDQLSQALLRADVSNLDALVVVNPDVESRRRVFDVMASALKDTSVVVELKSLEEFAAYLPQASVETDAVTLRDEVVVLEDELRELESRLEQLMRTQEDFESEQADLKSEQGDLRSEVDDLDYRVDELREANLGSQLERLQGEVRDLDARLDSMVP